MEGSVREMNISSALSVDDLLKSFVEQDLLPGTGVSAETFWTALEAVLT